MTRTYFVLFFVLIFLGVFFIGSLAATIAANMYQSREAGTLAGLIVKAIFAIAVYIIYKKRLETAGDNFGKADKFAFFLGVLFPVLWIILLIVGVTAKEKTDKPEHEEGPKESLPIKEISIYVVYGLAMVVAAAGYIMNIVEMVKYGSIMATSSIIFGVIGVVFPPLGVVRGFIYLF